MPSLLPYFLERKTEEQIFPFPFCPPRRQKRKQQICERKQTFFPFFAEMETRSQGGGRLYLGTPRSPLSPRFKGNGEFVCRPLRGKERERGAVFPSSRGLGRKSLSFLSQPTALPLLPSKIAAKVCPPEKSIFFYSMGNLGGSKAGGGLQGRT